MSNNNIVLLDQNTITLENIEFKLLYNEQNEKTDRRMEYKDRIEVIKVSSGNIKVIFTRTINFIPEGIFTLGVSISAIYKTMDSDKNQINEQEIEMDLKKDYGSKLILLISTASLHIAQITSSINHIPLITPPTLIE